MKKLARQRFARYNKLSDCAASFIDAFRNTDEYRVSLCSFMVFRVFLLSLFLASKEITGVPLDF